MAREFLNRVFKNGNGNGNHKNADDEPAQLTTDPNYQKIEPQALDDVVIGELQDSIEDVLVKFGWDMTNPSVENTPKRFLEYLAEFHQPFDIEEILGTPFDSPDMSMVIQDGIPFRMICEHHLLPAIGRAALGYLPAGKVIGLSKLTRLVQAVGTEKPSLQEHISSRVVSTLEEHLAPKGVMLVIEAEHGCMSCRGVNTPSVITRTSMATGVFMSNGGTRAEFLSIAQRGVNRRG